MRRSFDHGFAVVVGIKSYVAVSPLDNAVLRDAASFVEVLRNPNFCGYPDDQVRHLRDSKATGEAIRRELKWLAEVTSPDDTAIFFFSGHGFRCQKDGVWSSALVAADGTLDEPYTGLLFEPELSDLLHQIQAGRLLVILDSCFAAGSSQIKDSSPGSSRVKNGLSEAFYKRLGQGRGRALLASCRPDEFSYFARDGIHSRFTHHLLQVLEEGVEGKDMLGVLDLFEHLADTVPSHDAGPQHPVLKAEVENNFPIAFGPAVKPNSKDAANTQPAAALSGSSQPEQGNSIYHFHGSAVQFQQAGLQFGGGQFNGGDFRGAHIGDRVSQNTPPDKQEAAGAESGQDDLH